MAVCPKLNGTPDNRSDEDKLRDCQGCEYYKAEYGMYLCKYHEMHTLLGIKKEIESCDHQLYNLANPADRDVMAKTYTKEETK